jgi:hypothetical protein
MSSQTWIQCVAAAPGAGSAIVSGGPTTLLTAGQLASAAAYTFPTNFFYYVGQKFRVKAHGILTCGGANNLTLSLLFGAAVIVATTSPMALIAAGRTNVPWELDFTCTMRAIAGSASNNIYSGHFLSEGILASTAFASGVTGWYLLPTAVSSNWDNTTTEKVDLQATLSGASDSITLHDYALEAMN